MKYYAEKFVNHFDAQLDIYRTNNVLILWGDDFAHERAENTYTTCNNAIKAINSHLDSKGNKRSFNLKFSTIQQYLDSVYNDANKNNIEFSRYEGDLWKYDHDGGQNTYWTGYFTTQPDFKRAATDYSDFAESA